MAKEAVSIRAVFESGKYASKYFRDIKGNTIARDYYEGYPRSYITQEQAKKRFDVFIYSLDKLKSANVDHQFTRYPYKEYWTFERFIQHRNIGLVGE